ncbi:hypothetical protein ACOSP7_018770 [Xanthoceras sorbifolium]|uniref:Pollen Ole e 1 allergen and extensin family protein n=1 Tax=Xanthoceras sorbifolium TaxID=99658 RepID=A0ABQ8I237_9ROSI|nr:hypothetical protein JRO89_XS05G0129500 [Xanthoceras sorbifolium]
MLLQKLLQISSSMSASIDHIPFVLVLLAFLFLHHPVPLKAEPPAVVPTSRITVVGVVFCDTCSTNTFSRHSYFLPGAEVEIQCKFQANSPKTNEQITFSVSRTTDNYGVYKLEIPHVDGVDCVDGMAIESLCQASLIGSSSSSTCNVPGLKKATNEISVKSKQDSLCIYSLKALSYRPSKRNYTLCNGKNNSKESLQEKGTSNSKSTLPFPFTPTPSLFPSPPPPPAFNLGDPRTWIPNVPLLSPPPPPEFNPLDPRTWIPYFPPSPSSTTSQSQKQKP